VRLSTLRPAASACQHGAWRRLVGTLGLRPRLSARIGPKGPRFRLVVSGRLGKLGNPASASSGYCKRKGGAAALLAESEAKPKRADKRRRQPERADKAPPGAVLTSGGPKGRSVLRRLRDGAN
jgi:hypothetical protein